MPLERPEPDEYDAFYAGYVASVEGADALGALEAQAAELPELLAGLDDRGAAYRYAEGKWSVKEVLGHLIDTERIFTYRALAIARGDTASLPGMDQDDWAAGSNAAERSLASLVDEFEAVRWASVALVAGFEPAAETRSGEASGCPFTVRTLVWIIAGHELWHRGLIARDYLGDQSGGGA